MPLVVLTILAQARCASAFMINDIQLNVSGSGQVWVTEDITVYGNETTLELLLPAYSNIEFISAGAVIPYYSKNVDSGMSVSLNLPNLPAGAKQRDVSVIYETPHLTTKNGSIWSISFSTEATPRKTILKLYLPKNSTILLPSLKPRDILFSVDRDSLWLYPQEVDFNFTCDYEYSGGPTVISPDVPDDGRLRLIASVLFAALLISAALLYYLLRSRTSPKVVGKVEVDDESVQAGESLSAAGDMKKTTEVGGIEFEFKTENSIPKIKETVLNILNEEEKNIIVFIQEKWPEDITQALIYKTIRMPKSSLSEVIKRLERRNVIECRREGRLNWIKLKKWILE